MKLLIFIFLSLLSLVATADNQLEPTHYLNLNNSFVAVYESEGTKGDGVLLVHGNTSSAQSFEKILNSEFAKHNRVVAMDLPGFGHSGHLTSYSAGIFANTIAEVAKNLHLDSGVIVGWSLGGDLVLQASSLLPNASGFFLFGTGPVGYAPELPLSYLTPDESYAGAAVFYGFNPNLTNSQVTDYVQAFFRPGFNAPSLLIAEGLSTDPNTRLAVYLAAIGQDPTFQDEVSIVRNLNRPVALVLGRDDAFVRPDFLTSLAPSVPMLWNHQVQFINNTGHAIQWERPQRFIATLKQFIHDVKK